MPNSFKALFQARKKELYIVAMNLDSAERVVFGHDEDSSLSISESVQASTALPGFYRPARIRGIDYVDGGVRRTANIDVAIDHGADLVICYNPFRPFSNRVVRKYDPQKDDYVAEGVQLADRGMLTILNQVLRTLLHSRLQLGLRQYQDDPNFKGDIILIEPTEKDLDFFQMTPLAFWERRRAAQHGYESVTQSIEIHYDMIRRIMESYGILMTRKTVSEGMQRMRTGETPEEASDFLDARRADARDLGREGLALPRGAQAPPLVVVARNPPQRLVERTAAGEKAPIGVGAARRGERRRGRDEVVSRGRPRRAARSARRRVGRQPAEMLRAGPSADRPGVRSHPRSVNAVRADVPDIKPPIRMAFYVAPGRGRRYRTRRC